MATSHFKMERLTMLRDLLRPGDWMASIDLKDTYLSVAIWEGHRKYLRFMWNSTIYEFQCLPFGLCSAPRVFTKLLKPVLAQLHHLGVRLVMYMDDMLMMAQRKDNLVEQLCQITSLLQTLGFIVNQEKSQLTLSQKIHYLGFVIDPADMKIRLTAEKVTQIAILCREAQQKQTLVAQELAHLIGKMTATLPAIYQAPLWYRELQCLKNQAIQESLSFDQPVLLNPEAQLELQWWSTRLAQANGKSVLTQEPDLVVETDASLQGWGAICKGIRTGGPWLQTEREHHINYLELLAATLAVKTFTKGQKDIHIHLRMDNQTAVFYVNHMGGTRSETLSRLAIQLWQWWRNLSLSAEYLPGVDNCIADQESRAIQSSAEWYLKREVFQQVMTVLGECSADLFAS